MLRKLPTNLGGYFFMPHPVHSKGKEKGKEEYLYSAFLYQGTHKALRCTLVI